MKHLIYTAIVLTVVGLAGCKKLVSFKMDFDDTVTIPANAVINIPIDIIAQENTTNSEQEFSNNGTGTNLISKVVLNRLDLTIKNPVSANFNFLKSVQVYLSSPGLPEVLIAHREDVPATGLQELPLTCENTDLKEYIKKSTYSVRVKAVTDEAVTQNTDVNVHSQFQVDAGIF